ncbi:MAG: uracil-DNA glycosylase family protein [Janthinobacterium lividum]
MKDKLDVNMNKTAKIQQLELLRDEIEASMTNAWLFPNREPVQGFLGTGSVMFVGERPSTSNFNCKPARFLYSLLEKHRVPDAHLTDVIKTRAGVNDPYPEDLSLYWHFLNRELKIIQPRLVIAFGPKVYNILQLSLSVHKLLLKQINHYASTRWGANKENILDEQIRLAVTSTPLLASEQNCSKSQFLKL